MHLIELTEENTLKCSAIFAAPRWQTAHAVNIISVLLNPSFSTLR